MGSGSLKAAGCEVIKVTARNQYQGSEYRPGGETDLSSFIRDVEEWLEESVADEYKEHLHYIFRVDAYTEEGAEAKARQAAECMHSTYREMEEVAIRETGESAMAKREFRVNFRYSR